MARLGSARLGSARLGSARLGSARLGSARLGSARLGSARLGSARLGSAQQQLGQIGLQLSTFHFENALVTTEASMQAHVHSPSAHLATQSPRTCGGRARRWQRGIEGEVLKARRVTSKFPGAELEMTSKGECAREKERKEDRKEDA
ncbi:hypothetical protein F5148DRAFT_1371320 [Russula earlei]|uniref:Uncharacterized protein n=1 Tax=Russula earlei TaxID=71964 RepID=A0ACC0TU68_9AGAM|nr:hypothetical protein F5148DRAFT_1371320 [Russula earlei]